MATGAEIDLMALCRIKGVSWAFLAREAQRPDGIVDLLQGRASEESTEATESLALIRSSATRLPEFRETTEEMVAALDARGISLTTVLDDDYPANLRLIFNPPPFLTYRGTLRADDARSVAVVGTRDASPEGVARASRLARSLTQDGVTVLSGLARGIDTAAHEATLDAGGRTIAVMGTGINRVYPPENAALAERIVANGALVSQFWPDSPPRQDTFPRRNIVMSGMGQGTVVIEASSTSGAKMQARYALEQGKRLFLLSSLVEEREWARTYLRRPGAVEVREVDDIIRQLQSPETVAARSAQRRQLSLALG